MDHKVYKDPHTRLDLYPYVESNSSITVAQGREESDSAMCDYKRLFHPLEAL